MREPATPDAEAEALAARAAVAGAPLSPDEAARLCAGDVLTLGGIADGLRRARHGDAVALVKVRLLPWLDHGEGAAPAGEALRAVRPAEVGSLARAAGLPPRVAVSRLEDAGLTVLALPSPADDPGATREGLQAAHGAGLATDAPVVYGARTTPADLAAALLALRARWIAGEEFRSAVPVPDSLPEQSPLTGTTGLEDLRAFSCARILLAGVPRIAAEVDLLGAKLAAVALSFGADTLAGARCVPTTRLAAADADRPRPFNADRARLLLAEAGRTPAAPPPFPPREA